MKHLKTYKIFEAFTEELLLDIRDILYELEDNGFNIKQDRRSISNIKIEITADFKFKLNDVKNTLLRIFDYNNNYIKDSAKNLWINVVCQHRIMGAKTWYNSDKNGFLYRINIGKDYRLYSERSRPYDSPYRPLTVSFNNEVNKVIIEITSYEIY